jgi:hypothetical protein
MSKKEGLMFQRELDKLNKSIGGIKDMNGLPSAIFMIDVGYHKIAVLEALASRLWSPKSKVWANSPPVCSISKALSQDIELPWPISDRNRFVG